MFHHESKVRKMLQGMIRSRSIFLVNIAKEAEAATNPRKARHICFLLEAEAIEIKDIARMIRSDLMYERARKRQAKIDSGIAYAGMKRPRMSEVVTMKQVSQSAIPDVKAIETQLYQNIGEARVAIKI